MDADKSFIFNRRSSAFICGSCFQHLVGSEIIPGMVRGPQASKGISGPAKHTDSAVFFAGLSI
jgi:hypothetical protein